MSDAELMKNYQIYSHTRDRLLCFEPATQRLITREGSAAQVVDLGYAPSRVLELLICRADTIVSRDDIFAFAWPGRVVGQNSLNQAIATLRELLGDEEKRQIIQTVPRHGYRLNSSFVSSAQGEIAERDIIPPITEDVVSARVFLGKTLVQRVIRLLATHGLFVGLCGLLVILGASLLWRIDWVLLGQPGMVSVSRQLGEQQQLFVAANAQALSELEEEVSPLSVRLGNLVEAPTAVIFTKMHSFYSLFCVGQDGTSEFITVHRSRLRGLTDGQLRACLQ